MALNLPTADPVTFYHRPISNGRVVILANSSVSWSAAQAQRYARKKHIPLSNIVSVAMGTSRTLWEPVSNAAWRTAFIQPLRAKFDAVGAQMVLAAPGVPMDTRIIGVTTGAVYDPVATAAVPTPLLAGEAREIDDRVIADGPTVLAGYFSGLGNLLVYLDLPGPGPTYTFAGLGLPKYRLGVGALSGTTDPLYGTVYEGLNAEEVVLPTRLAFDTLGATTNRVIPFGRIGVAWGASAYATPTTPPSRYNETSETGGRLMDQGTRYAEGLSPGNRYQQPVHFQFTNTTTLMQSCAYLHSQLVGWGYPSTYFWRTSSAGVPQMETYAPVAGSAYTLAALQAGRVRDRPYHLMIGDASNDELPGEPFESAWQPSAGGNSHMGPSEGWLYSVNGQYRGAGQGFANTIHVTSGTYSLIYERAHMVLQGYTWPEAMYYAGQTDYWNYLPTGDPLARSFPR